MRPLAPRWPRSAGRDPGLAAPRSAARGAIVRPAVLAFSDQVITGLIEFSGRCAAVWSPNPVLACADAASVVLGTRCSRDSRLAAGTTALVTFAILSAGVINGYVAAGPAAMLTFIFAVTIPAPFLGGAGAAGGMGICGRGRDRRATAAVAVAPGHGAAWRRGAGLAGAGRPGRGDIRARPAADARPDPGGQDGGLRPAAVLPGCASPAVRPDRTAGRARLGGGQTRTGCRPC